MIKYLRFFILALISTSAFTNAFAVNPFFTIPTLFCFFIALLYFLIIANTKFKFNIDKGVSLFFFCIVFTITTLINQRGEKTINQYILWIFSFLFCFEELTLHYFGYKTLFYKKCVHLPFLCCFICITFCNS